MLTIASKLLNFFNQVDLRVGVCSSQHLSAESKVQSRRRDEAADDQLQDELVDQLRRAYRVIFVKAELHLHEAQLQHVVQYYRSV